MTLTSSTSVILRVSSPTGTLHLRMGQPGDVENEYPDVHGDPLHVVPLREPLEESAGLAALTRAGRLLLEAAVVGADGSHLAAAVAVHGLTDAEALALARGEGHDVVYALTPQTFCVVSGDGGRRHRWAVFRDAEAWRIRHWTARRPGSWELVSDQPATGVLEALTDVPALRLVRADVVNEYTLDPKVTDPKSLVQHLRLQRRDGVDCGGSRRDEVDEWWCEGELIESMLSELPLVARWCRVGDYRIAGVPRGRRLVPVAVDLDQEAIVPRQELAEHTWFSESGGAPTSWGGGSRLVVLDDGLLLAQWWGDNDQPATLVACRQTPRSQARAIAQWLAGQQLDVLAAMRLEPFDPRGTLIAAERDVWRDRFEAVTPSLSLYVGSECLDILRRLLRRSPAYRRTRTALATPGGRAGRALAAVLDDLETDGVLGDLLYGNWPD